MDGRAMLAGLQDAGDTGAPQPAPLPMPPPLALPSEIMPPQSKAPVFMHGMASEHTGWATLLEQEQEHAQESAMNPVPSGSREASDCWDCWKTQMPQYWNIDRAPSSVSVGQSHHSRGSSPRTRLNSPEPSSHESVQPAGKAARTEGSAQTDRRTRGYRAGGGGRYGTADARRQFYFEKAVHLEASRQLWALTSAASVSGAAPADVHVSTSAERLKADSLPGSAAPTGQVAVKAKPQQPPFKPPPSKPPNTSRSTPNHIPNTQVGQPDIAMQSVLRTVLAPPPPPVHSGSSSHGHDDPWANWAGPGSASASHLSVAREEAASSSGVSEWTDAQWTAWNNWDGWWPARDNSSWSNSVHNTGV